MKNSLLIAAFLACATPSCIITSDDDDSAPVDVVGDGMLTVDWTINGTKDPDQCDQANAATTLVSVFTVNGDFVGDFETSCDAFALDVELPPGSYVADAVLLDPGGFERTTTVEMNTFRILGDDILQLDIDFPASSFF